MQRYKEQFKTNFNTRISKSTSKDDMISKIYDLLKRSQYDHPYYIKNTENNFYIGMEDIENLFRSCNSISETQEILFNYIDNSIKDYYNKNIDNDTFENFIKNMNFKSKDDYEKFKEKFF